MSRIACPWCRRNPRIGKRGIRLGGCRRTRKSCQAYSATQLSQFVQNLDNFGISSILRSVQHRQPGRILALETLQNLIELLIVNRQLVDISLPKIVNADNQHLSHLCLSRLRLRQIDINRLLASQLQSSQQKKCQNAKYNVN